MDEWLLADGRLSLVPVLRVERAGPFTLWSPKLGLAWELPWNLRLTANAGQSHRAPSFIELRVPQGGMLPNPDLVPERALSADVGLAHGTDVSQVSATAFYALYENLIAYEYYAPLLPRPYNFPAADVRGVELGARLTPGEWLAASASWTLLFSRNLRDDPRFYLKELPYRPRHRGQVRVEAGPSVLRGRVQVEAQSAQFTNRVQSRVLPARALVHAGVSSALPLQPRVGVSVEVRNALDAQAEDFNGFPLPGRAVFLTVTMGLGDEAEVAQ
ncbi:MAG: TonB-dependent receptor [Myxococcaceae bacterium]|nr:TonB-dependent receptor [Myxococcaceae bacterium]